MLRHLIPSRVERRTFSGNDHQNNEFWGACLNDKISFAKHRLNRHPREPPQWSVRSPAEGVYVCVSSGTQISQSWACKSVILLCRPTPLRWTQLQKGSYSITRSCFFCLVFFLLPRNDASQGLWAEVWGERPLQRKTKGGGKTQGRGKHTINPLPKNGFGPPIYDTIPPPPFVHAMSFSLEETDTDQTNPTFWGLQNWFWRGCFMVRFPPQKSHDTFCPPPLRIPNHSPNRLCGTSVIAWSTPVYSSDLCQESIWIGRSALHESWISGQRKDHHCHLQSPKPETPKSLTGVSWTPIDPQKHKKVGKVKQMSENQLFLTFADFLMTCWRSGVGGPNSSWHTFLRRSGFWFV